MRGGRIISPLQPQFDESFPGVARGTDAEPAEIAAVALESHSLSILCRAAYDSTDVGTQYLASVPWLQTWPDTSANEVQVGFQVLSLNAT